MSVADNASFMDLLDADFKVEDAALSCIRSLMYHKFTRAPKRGFAARILPAIPVLTLAEWMARGVAAEDLVPDGIPWWADGAVIYEHAEARLDRLDYECRLTARTVDRYEWTIRRRIARRRDDSAMLARLREAFALGIVAAIADALCNRRTL